MTTEEEDQQRQQQQQKKKEATVEPPGMDTTDSKNKIRERMNAVLYKTVVQDHTKIQERTVYDNENPGSTPT